MSFESTINRFAFSGLGGLIGAETRVEVYRALELLTRNNVPPHQSLDALYAMFSKDGKKPKNTAAFVISHWRRAIASGKTLANAIAPWVPPSEINLIRAGENSGELANTLNDTMYSIRSRQKITSAMRRAIAGPLLLGAITIVLLYMISTQFVPSFERILPVYEWPQSALILRSISDVMLNQGLLLLIVLGVGFALTMYSLPNLARGRLRVRLDNFGPWAIYRILNGSSFLLSLAVLTRAGIPVKDALVTLSQNATPWMRYRIVLIIQRIKDGATLGKALSDINMNFPDEKAVRFLRIISAQKGSEDKLVGFANEWLDRSIELIEEKTAVIKMVFILALFGVLLLTAFAFSGVFISISQ